MKEEIVRHFKENKKLYVGLGIGLVVGGITVFLVMTTRSKVVSKDIIMPRFWSPGDNNIMKVFINPLGDPGNIVQCIETGTVYASQGQAARELGETATNVSNHLHGKLPDLHGLHLVILGKAGKVLAENT